MARWAGARLVGDRVSLVIRAYPTCGALETPRRVRSAVHPCKYRKRLGYYVLVALLLCTRLAPIPLYSDADFDALGSPSAPRALVTCGKPCYWPLAQRGPLPSCFVGTLVSWSW